MAGQNPGVNMDQFEVFFKRADLDGDGRISGAEAVAFLQGSNLPKQVLAQIWTYADQSHTGFLSRPEFYNALRLVTVAQTKRDLTPDIVKAALYTPAAARIPPPQINLSPAPANQVNPGTAVPSSQMGTTIPATSQGLGFRGPGVPNASMNQHYFPPQQSQQMRPPQAIPPASGARLPQGIGPDFRGSGMVGYSHAMPTGTASRPPQSMGGVTAGPDFRGSGMAHSLAMPTGTASRPPQSMGGVSAGPSISNSNNNWLGGMGTGALAGPRGISPNTPAVTSQPQNPSPVSSQPAANDSKALFVSGNGLATESNFGSDVFSATPTTTKQDPSASNFSGSSAPVSSTAIPVSAGAQPLIKAKSLDSLQSAYAVQPLGAQPQRPQSPSSGQQLSAPSSSSSASSSISAGVGNSSDTSQLAWPKMKPSDIQKYTKVFMEVDTDRDGRITGEQARNLFLSWRLPREVLKQVWDLSDQDSDSMLSLKEFCFALYLMERYREGRPLPASLPSNVMFDEMLLSMTGQSKVSYGNVAWGPSPGFGPQPGVATRQMAPASGVRPPVPVTQPAGAIVSNQQTSRAPVLGDSFLNQHGSGEQNSANSMLHDGAASEKMVDQPENVILDSKEKIEFYRTKMQELVLYKSRCDNRLNEITERAIADKREAELLGKKYEEKYKQVAEVASKLTVEEATFRDIQERKMELRQAIVNMEQGGSADGLLQVRADRIQSDLDELTKALTERCKKHGLDIKSSAMIELPFGWQPGIQEGAAPWDEEWDKFEDEGFSSEITVDVKNVPGSPKSMSDTSQKEKSFLNDTLTSDSLSNGHGKSGNFPGTGELESESAHTHSEDELARSPQDSPAGRNALKISSQEFSDVFEKSPETDAETHRRFDESMWGDFDGHDDVDSVWGFNPSSTKDSDSEQHRDFFGSDDFGVKPIRTESPATDSIFQKKSAIFEDSVPGTPVSRFGNSPRYSEAGDHYDNFSGLDSFGMHESGFSPRDKLARFDSMNSTKDLGHSHAFSSFDDSDPFGSSGPFKVSSDTQTPKKGSDNWNAF